MKLAVAVAFLVLAAPAHADGGFDVKGWRLGMTRAELVAAEPRFQCKPSGPDCFLIPGDEYGPTRARGYVARFVDDRAVALHVVVPSEAFAPLVASLEARYGPPAKRVAGTVQNRAGATFPDRTVEWRRGAETLVARERSANVDEAAVTLTSEAGDRALAREREAAARAAAARL